MTRTSSQVRRAPRGSFRASVISVGTLLFAACGGSGGSRVEDVPATRGVEVHTTAVPAVAPPPDPAAENAVNDVVEGEPVHWVAAHQSRDGRWEVGGWNRWSMGERVSGEGLTGLGSAPLDVAATALAVMAYTGAGYTVEHEGRGPVIAWALHALLYRQDADGAFGDLQDRYGPVNHGLAVLALTEAAELRPEPRLVEAVRRGVDCYRRARAADEARWTDDHAFGGLPPFAWLALASDAARRPGKPEADGARPSATGLENDPDLVRDRTVVASWITLPDAERTMARLGAGLALGVRDLDGGKDHRGVVDAAAWLAARVPVWNATGEGVDPLAWWLGSRGVFQVGGEPWKRWEAALKHAVVDTQRKDGSYGDLKGSWDPVGVGAAEGGRVVATLACDLMLEIWYRYDKVFGDAGVSPAQKPARAPAARPAPAGVPAKGAPALPHRRYPPRR